jgi:hypothetical protein
VLRDVAYAHAYHDMLLACLPDKGLSVRKRAIQVACGCRLAVRAGKSKVSG